MDEIDRAIVNRLQGGFPVTEFPFREIAPGLRLSEDELIRRIGRMLESGALTRFGPLYNVEQAGGAFTLAALSVPDADFERASAIVNAMPEVAHNYQRDHPLNMWFVLATETPDGIGRAVARIERDTGYHVVDLPKQREYFVGLKLEA
jgi:siroheme decarboxylase